MMKFTKDDIITTDKYLNAFPDFYYKTDCFFSESMVWRNKIVTPPPQNLPLLISGHSDISIENYMVDAYNPQIWFSVNNQTTKYHVHSLPLGLTNYTNETDLHPVYGNCDILIDVMNETIETTGLVYMNFNIHTHHERKHIWDLFKDKSWVNLGEIHNTLDGRKTFLREIKSHHFVLCPRGNGLDTHRLWETLYMGSIPIVKRELGYEQFYDLPICFVDNWEDINEQFLENERHRILHTNYAMEKLKIGYWIDKISQFAV